MNVFSRYAGTLLVILELIFSNYGWGQNETVHVTIDYSHSESVSSYRAGVTHTQYSLDPWGNSQAIYNAKFLLDSVTYFQNQHIIGWGTTNLWPDSTVTDPENWDWESLDRRISLIRETSGNAIITLCACPTWMHDPQKNGQTDWTLIEKAPSPSHYDDFAHLCAEVARRYPDVIYYQVWNELKGFWNDDENRWDYESYTELYNMVYDSLRIVNAELKIGGPYIGMDSWSSGTASHPSSVQGEYGVLDQRPLDVLTYWLENKKGADFICVDGWNTNKNLVWTTDAFSATQKFVDVFDWIRKQSGGEYIPIWWSELYVYPRETWIVNKNYLNALMTIGLIKGIKAGYSNLMIWQPQGDDEGFSCPLGIWTNTEITGGGKPTPFYYTQKGINSFFSEGAKIYQTNLSDNIISVLATDSTILLVNQKNNQVSVTVNDYPSQIVLAPYEVLFLHNPDLITTSITTPELINHFKVFPNPFVDQILIQLNLAHDELIKVELIQMNGVKVLSKNYKCISGQNKLSINTNEISQGIYLLNISSNVKDFKRIVIKS